MEFFFVFLSFFSMSLSLSLSLSLYLSISLFLFIENNLDAQKCLPKNIKKNLFTDGIDAPLIFVTQWSILLKNNAESQIRIQMKIKKKKKIPIKQTNKTQKNQS